jgi:hypothetical protein
VVLGGVVGLLVGVVRGEIAEFDEAAGRLAVARVRGFAVAVGDRGRGFAPAGCPVPVNGADCATAA